MLTCLLLHLLMTSFPFLSYLPPSQINPFSQPETDTPTLPVTSICAFSPLCLSGKAGTSPGAEGRGRQHWAPLHASLKLINQPPTWFLPPTTEQLPFHSFHGRRSGEALQQKSWADLDLEHSPRISILFPLPCPLTCPQHPTKSVSSP